MFFENCGPIPGLLADTVWAVSLTVADGASVVMPGRPKLVDQLARPMRFGANS